MLTKLYRYSRTSIIRTPLCHLNHKSVQISEFVQISEAHSLIIQNYSNRTYTSSSKYSVKTVSRTVRIIEGSDNRGSDNRGSDNRGFG